jgi:hypothetical protein
MPEGRPTVKSRRDPLERSLVGPAGEHWVLYCLYRRGLLAALAPPGVPEVDILVLDAHREVAASIQVKTRTIGLDQGWACQPKHESIEYPDLFYALVDLEPERPVTYIVHSSVVAAVLRSNQREWLTRPGVRGQPHKDSKVRRLRPTYGGLAPGFEDGWLETYRDGWDAIRAKTGRED